MTTGEAAAALFIPRTIKSAIMLPVQVITINVLWKYIGSHINKSSYAKEH
jgi:hypothetical protein